MVAFSLFTNQIKSKRFAGLFAAAPSVAVTSLALTALLMSADKASLAALAMVAGAIGLAVFCLVAALLEKRTGAIVGSGVAWVSWLLTAGLAFWVLFQ